MIKRFFHWLLSFFLTGKQQAEVEAAQQAGEDYDQQQVAAAVAAQGEIVHETEIHVAAVPGESDDDLRHDAISLGLVSDDSDQANNGRCPFGKANKKS